MMEKKKIPRKSGNRGRIVAFAAAVSCILIPTSVYAFSGAPSNLFEKVKDTWMTKEDFDILYNGLSSGGFGDEEIAGMMDLETNENRQTYGAEWLEPDLILVELEDGTKGYCYQEELNGKKFSSPEEALAWQEQNQKKYPDGWEIPVYQSDGETVIGHFKIGGQ